MSPGKAKKWQEDLQTMHTALLERHVDLYHEIPQDTFENAVAALHDDLPTLSVNQALVRLSEVIAMVGDGHTSMYPGEQRGMMFRFIPLHLWLFDDGMFVTAARTTHEHLIGKELLRIEGMEVGEVLRVISSTISADNDMEYAYTSSFHILRPELLHVLGVAPSADSVRFEFEGGITETFRSENLKAYRKGSWLTANSVYPDRRPVSRRLEYLFATPLTLPHLSERKYYWWEYLEEDETVFFQYNTCWDQKDRPTVAGMAEEIFAFMDQNPVERLIIDLRQNTGGEPLTARALIDGLAARTDFTSQGRLFVLVGRRTYSAALTNAAELRRSANARLVGEPPRGKPNSPSEGRDIDLPKTKIWMTVSTQFVERDPDLGDAAFLPLDFRVPKEFASYRDAIDADLEAALSAPLLLGAQSAGRRGSEGGGG